MNKEKQTYEAPAAETLVVRFEGALLTGSDSVKSNAIQSLSYDDDDPLEF